MNDAPKRRGRPPKVRVDDSHANVDKSVTKNPNFARWENFEAAEEDHGMGPQYVPPEIIPDGIEYQWVNDTVHGEKQATRFDYERTGWMPVPADRPGHEGRWMASGSKGEIIYKGMVLMERPKYMSDRARAKELRAAREQVFIKEAQLKGGDIKGVSLDTQHPRAIATNRISKSYEPIPKD